MDNKFLIANFWAIRKNKGINDPFSHVTIGFVQSELEIAQLRCK